MAASGGGLSSPTSVAAAMNTQTVARARFPGRPCTSRISRLRLGKRTKRGRLSSDDGETSDGGPRPIDLGLALSEDPALLRLLGVTEKYKRRRESGFDSSHSEEEEDFGGFGAPKGRRHNKVKPPEDRCPSPKPLIGKIHPRVSLKSSLIGKIVPRTLNKGKGLKGKGAPKAGLGGKPSDEHASGSSKSDDEAGAAQPDETLLSLPAATERAKTSKVKVDDEVSEDAMPPRKRGRGLPLGHNRLTMSSLQRRHRKKKSMAASPEIGAEAGVQSGQEAAMPLEGKSQVPSAHRTHKRNSRKSLFGYKRKTPKNASPTTASLKRAKRAKHVFYTYVTDPVTTAPQEADPGSLFDRVQANSSALTTARSSRVIKTPKRFLDEGLVPFPRGNLSSWLKNQQREDEKTSTSSHESACDIDSISAVDSPSAVAAKLTPPPGYGTSHLEFYKNLKRLTLKLAERRGQFVPQSEDTHSSVVNPRVKRRRKSKLTMEEIDSPGVVRKLAVSVSSNVKLSSQTLQEDTGKNNESGSGDVRQAVEAVPSHRVGLSGANKRMLHLLKKAKVQLIKIDQQKQYKLQLSSSESHVAVSRGRKRRVNLSPTLGSSQEQPLRGPRIKHVCRAAAVALGQPRAMVPDDIPRLSALPLHEREGIAMSPTGEDVADDDDDDDDDDISDQGRAQWIVSQEPLQRRRRGRRRGHRFKKRKILSRYAPGGVRSRRCGRCKGCLVDSDCAKCMNCRDKPKFGGPNKKRQCCIYRRCARIEQAKTERIVKQFKVRARRISAPMSSSEDANWKNESYKPLPITPNKIRKESLRNITPRSYWNLLKSESDEEQEEVKKLFKASKLSGKQDVLPQRGLSVCDHAPQEAVKQRRPFSKGVPGRPRANKNPSECTSVNALMGFTNGFPQKGLVQDKSKIRVDFKEDCAVQNVWLMGGLSILTSIPTTPQPVCLLCASKGRHDMIYCQICCEPFHSFCLSAEERPLEENKENWCCRRCKFCHVCGRRSKISKPVLQCRRCQTSYHPSCLGPTYPKPINCSLPWVCMTCIRCKSCGITPGKSWEIAWNHEENFCPDCAVLHEKGHFCPVCNKCYDHSSRPAQMIQCSKCSHWVHHACEGLSEELYGLLSSQADSGAFTCSPCCQHVKENSSLTERLRSRLLIGLDEVLTGLLTSNISQHLTLCKMCQETNKTEFNRERPSVCDLQAMHTKLKGGGYSSIKDFHADIVSVMRTWLKEEGNSAFEDERPTSHAREHYVKLMVQVFSWLPGHYQNKLTSFSENTASGTFPEAVLPPSKEHSYAQWTKRTYQPRECRGPQAGKADALGVKNDCETKDCRQCALCQQYGDSAPREGGRLLYMGQNEWAHVNCCLWSAEVYENNGALFQVHTAVSRGRHLRCDRCGQSGATVGCCLSTCQSNFHFMCARAQDCVFQEDRKVYCFKHRDLISVEMVSGQGFEVPRRVYVDFEGITLKRKFLTGLEPESINMTIGSLQIQKLGVLTELSSNGRMLYPVGYICSRLYWSTVDPRRRCKYTCKVTEVSTPLPGEEPDLKCDKEENHTIVHSPNFYKDAETPGSFSTSSSPLTSSTPSPNSKHNTPGSKHPSYTQTRRPAGGSSRPLPSPGSASSKSHQILTLRDLDNTHRRRRLSARSRCSSSPTDSDPSIPMTLRSGGTVHSRCALFSSPPRSSNLPPASPPLSRQNSLSPVWSSPSRSISAALPPLHMSPRGRHAFKITTLVSAEVPQDFLASSEAEDAAVATTNGISLAPDNTEEVAHLMAQELPYTVFDTDTEVAVASVLNAKLEFDETLLTDNLVLNCGAQGGRLDLDVQDVEMQEKSREADSEDDNSGHHIKLTRTVVCEAASSAQPSTLPSTQSIPQLDGADDGSESDQSQEANDDDARHGESSQSPDNLNTPTKQLSVALKRLESFYEASTSEQGGSEAREIQEDSSLPVFLGALDPHMSIQTEEVLFDKETPARDLFVKSTTNVDHDDASSIDSTEGFKDDANDPDYTPEPTSPMQVKKIMKKVRRTPSFKYMLPKQYVLPQTHKIKVILPSQSARIVKNTPMDMTAAPCTVTSPIVLNGINALNVQPGAPRGKTIAIRLDNSKPVVHQQAQLVGPNQAAQAAPPSTPQVLLVNRQGQILLKDSKTNTYQTLSSNSPTYSKISQIAKMLHSRTSLQRLAPRGAVKPCTSAQLTHVLPAGNHTPPANKKANKVVYRVVPMKRITNLSSPTPAPVLVTVHHDSEPSSAPSPVTLHHDPDPSPASSAVTVHRDPDPSPAAPLVTLHRDPDHSPVSVVSNDGHTQVIINRGMASYRDPLRTRPILSNTKRARAKRLRALFQEHTYQSAELPSDMPNVPADNLQATPARLRHVKHASSQKTSRKKSKMDFLSEPSTEPEDEHQDSSGVKRQAQPLKDLPDPNKENSTKHPLLRVTAPHPPMSSRHSLSDVGFAPTTATQGTTYKWVSARHGSLSEWDPVAGGSSEDEAPLPKYRRSTYMNQPHLRFEITSDDGFSVKANSMEVAWRAVIEGVLDARADFHMKQLPLGVMCGPRVLGVVHDAVIFLLEQLQGAANCKSHRFRFHRCDDMEEELPLNPSGCARTEVYTRKATFDMFNFLASQHRALPDPGLFDEEEDEFPLKSSRRATSSELPMAMRFRHLEKTSKEAVGVYRSLIHGRGLFCKRNIEAGEMVIEYAGTVIRSVLTDKREKYYDSKGIGCYMFRIDDFDVVDATMQGNAGRFINHSCEPNCYSRVINVDGRKHIVIFALRKIYRGEELTYDYKFPIEDDESKLHCNCGTRRCRRFLN
ncbi:histone-lysine N-methyltransferase 2B isoform X2 [Dunckerocampus dactyliophorus]|uniref:histone-lysine N-methyltransferase 2B isoform X2 n=1 Tax=Dunckerocampus dactyliophorus TaxID=161453 RepID=UPI002404D104|nr:histone-lysine N-methyltransferase 2B isoform X2 [Dunckerocampus dactyliophorus]